MSGAHFYHFGPCWLCPQTVMISMPHSKHDMIIHVGKNCWGSQSKKRNWQFSKKQKQIKPSEAFAVKISHRGEINSHTSKVSFHLSFEDPLVMRQFYAGDEPIEKNIVAEETSELQNGGDNSFATFVLNSLHLTAGAFSSLTPSHQVTTCCRLWHRF